MKDIISDPKKDPMGNMMLDYLKGDREVFVSFESNTLDMWQMKGSTMFRTFSQMERLEQKALSLCKGRTLDVGAGSGCHSLCLQTRNQLVDAMDISPGCVEVMKKRKVKKVIHKSLFSLAGKRYDTVLMLMNGLGICGSIDGLNLFFQFIKSILSKNGQIIADSSDLSILYDKASIESVCRGYYGETVFVMTYKDTRSDPFDWLYVDFDTLSFYAKLHGFSCEKIRSDKTGKYLTRIY